MILLVSSLARARQLSQLQYKVVVKLTTLLFCNWLSCLVPTRENQMVMTTVQKHTGRNRHKYLLIFRSLRDSSEELDRKHHPLESRWTLF